MKKRVLAGLLWFYVTWYAWSFIAAYAGLTELWGPVLGAAVAMLIAGDPMGRAWGGKRTAAAAIAAPSPIGEPA